MPLLCSWTTSDSSRLEPQWNCRHWCLKWMKTTLAKVREIVMMPLSCLVQTNQSSGSMPRDLSPQQGIYCTDDVFWNSYKSFSIWDACFLGGVTLYSYMLCSNWPSKYNTRLRSVCRVCRGKTKSIDWYLTVGAFNECSMSQRTGISMAKSNANFLRHAEPGKNLKGGIEIKELLW